MNEELPKDPKGQDVLLVTEKDGNKLQAVTGTDKDGTLKTTAPTPGNKDGFLKIDTHSDALENFMKNFLRQSKEPTHFQFFKVPMEKLEGMVDSIQKMLDKPDELANKEKLDTYRVLPEAYSKKEYQPVDESRIDWKQFENLGVTREMLEKTNSLDKLLNWQKTPVLLPIRAEIGDSIIRTDARLSLRETPEGKLSLMVHALRNKPELDRPFMGTKLTNEDKQNLLATGNAGRLVEIEPVKGQKMAAFVSVDKLTNELVALRADRIKIPDEIKGVKLGDDQKKALSEGKAIDLQDLTARNGRKYDATVQINADRRGLEFKFDNTNRLDRQQGRENQQQQSEGGQQLHIPSKLLGVELTVQQQEKLQKRETIYVAGMTDAKGESFNAYVKVNDEKDKLDFYRWNPDKAQRQGAQVTPDNNSKTQVAVNSEGKNNEATQKTGEPLKPNQTAPTEKQQEKQEKKEEKQEKKEFKKSGGRKM